MKKQKKIVKCKEIENCKLEKFEKLKIVKIYKLYFFSLKNQGSLFDTKIALCDNCMTMHALKPFDDFMTKLV